jgi:AcrR family transcriptional regulator
MKKRMSAQGRREQILAQAMRLFARKGFRGTTTREIAQSAGISEALMFKHFPSKEALYRAIIRQQTDVTHELFFPPEAVEAKEDHQVFRAVASHLFLKNSEDPTFLRLILYSALEGHEMSRIFFEQYAMERSRLLSRYIDQRIKEKEYKKVPPLLAARAFMGMVIHYVQSQEIYQMKKILSFPPEKVLDTFVDIFLNGLKKTNPHGSNSQLSPSI